jgi:hypothetical protein
MDLRDIGCCGIDRIEVGPVEASCDHCNEPCGSMKFSEILERLSDWRLLQKDLAPASQLFSL